jgi:hypothetical protein
MAPPDVGHEVVTVQADAKAEGDVRLDMSRMPPAIGRECLPSLAEPYTPQTLDGVSFWFPNLGLANSRSCTAASSRLEKESSYQYSKFESHGIRLIKLEHSDDPGCPIKVCKTQLQIQPSTT